ncbi:cation:proton antiporter [uncultured Jannaschia sp.]|uniref:cation:proton antiporter domain-containing protein n=1 Tax=uncultured Jannaschia sp. TaxID=293347 RepID=UPI0026109FA1|nr:cation:proton antiporter [uncultured Jannaschia sp.]
MNIYHFVALILVTVGPVLALARGMGLPPSLVLFGVGLLSTALPGLPDAPIDSELLQSLFLPPLLYASTVRVSWHLLRFTWVPGLLVGAFMVPTTVVAVASVALVVLPGLSWTTALLLGVVTAVFDTRLFHEADGRPHVPRALSDSLKARELVARLLALATFGLLIDTAQESRFAPLRLLEHYVLDLCVGVALGILIGRAIVRLRTRIDPAPVEIAVSIVTPYAASLAATALGVSGVATITAAALAVSAVRVDRRSGAPISSSEARINAVAFWEEVSLIVSSVLFLLAGRALPQALAGLDNQPLPHVAAAAVAILALVLVVQFVMSWFSTAAPPISRFLSRRRPEGTSRVPVAGVMAWSSTRSVIGLVLALSLPEALPDGTPFPDRDLILVIGALTIVGSILLQGLTLNRVATYASLSTGEEQSREEAAARHATEGALARPGAEHANGFDAARQALLRLREQDRIGDEVLIEMLREVDLASRAEEDESLPGAGPPNP